MVSCNCIDSPCSPVDSKTCTEKLETTIGPHIQVQGVGPKGVSIAPHVTKMVNPSEARRHLPATLGKCISRRSAYTAERRAEYTAVWDQIRRTEEELMEMGTMDNTPLQDHGVGTEGLVSTVETLSRTGA